MDGARLGGVIALKGSPCAAPEFSTLPKSFRKEGGIPLVWLSPVSAKSAFLAGEATMSRRHLQAFPLYDRLGGIYAIASVVGDFIDRIMD